MIASIKSKRTKYRNFKWLYIDCTCHCDKIFQKFSGKIFVWVIVDNSLKGE